MTKSANFSAEYASVENMRRGGFVRLSTILTIIPIGKSLLWEMVARGDFPQPVKLSCRVTAWRCNDIIAFIESRGCSAAL